MELQVRCGHSIPEQNNLTVYSQADAWPCLLCPQKFQNTAGSTPKSQRDCFSINSGVTLVFCFFLSPLLLPLQGHSVFPELYMNVTSGFIKKNLFLSIFYSICVSHYVIPHLSWFIVSVLQHGLIHGSVLDSLPDSSFWFDLWCTFLRSCRALTSPCRLCILIVISTTLYLPFFNLSRLLKQ